MADDDCGEGSNCDEALEQLYEYIDGELTADRRDAIRQHLDDCGPCLDAVDFEDALRKVLADKCRDSVPDALRDKVAAAIDAEQG